MCNPTHKFYPEPKPPLTPEELYQKCKTLREKIESGITKEKTMQQRLKDSNPTTEQIVLIKQRLEKEKQLEKECRYGTYLKFQEDYFR